MWTHGGLFDAVTKHWKNDPVLLGLAGELNIGWIPEDASLPYCRFVRDEAGDAELDTSGEGCDSIGGTFEGVAASHTKADEICTAIKKRFKNPELFVDGEKVIEFRRTSPPSVTPDSDAQVWVFAIDYQVMLNSFE